MIADELLYIVGCCIKEAQDRGYDLAATVDHIADGIDQNGFMSASFLQGFREGGD